MDTRARHLLVELHGCEPLLLNDLQRVRQSLLRAAQQAGATVVAEVFHPYRPQGVTGVVVIEESHFAIHTWPEHGYAAVDFYTCGPSVPERAVEVLKAELRAERTTLLRVERGLPEADGAIRVELASAGEMTE